MTKTTEENENKSLSLVIDCTESLLHDHKLWSTSQRQTVLESTCMSIRAYRSYSVLSTYSRNWSFRLNWIYNF